MPVQRHREPRQAVQFAEHRGKDRGHAYGPAGGDGTGCTPRRTGHRFRRASSVQRRTGPRSAQTRAACCGGRIPGSPGQVRLPGAAVGGAGQGQPQARPGAPPPAPQAICPHTGRARPGYDRARVLFKKYTATGDCLKLHQLRHSAATDLGDQKVPHIGDCRRNGAHGIDRHPGFAGCCSTPSGPGSGSPADRS